MASSAQVTTALTANDAVGKSLQALQVKQQLGAQALSIANQAPQIILSLFNGGS